MSSRWDHRSLARRRVLPGDIIGTTPENLRGTAVQTFQSWRRRAWVGPNQAFQPDIVHVAISLGGDALVEALRTPGVQASSLYHYSKPFAVFRPRWSDQSQPDMVCRHARRCIGDSYAKLLPLLRHLLAKAQARAGGGAPPADPAILICSTFVVDVFTRALGSDSPFEGFRAPSGLPVFLPADVVAAPTLQPISP